MAVNFKDSKTKENLMKAFAGESQARNRYTIAAEQAEKEGLQTVRDIFLFTADQERAHAERYYDLLKDLAGETVDICGGYPIDNHGEMTKVLRSAMHNEFEEYEDVYQEFGDVAKEEGFMEAASAFYLIAEVEKIHGKRFEKVADMLEQNTFFESESESSWMCMNCGYIHTGKKVPEYCPSCRHGKGYFLPLELAPYMGNIER